MNDPTKTNITGGSGNPQGWSIYTSMFKRYVVLGSRIHWRIRNMQPGGGYGSLGTEGAAPTVSCMYAVVLVPTPSSATAATSMGAAAVQKYATRRHDFPRNRSSDGSSGFPEPTQLNPAETWSGSRSMAIHKIDGEPNLRQSNYEAIVSASPTLIPTWLFYFQDLLSDTTAKGVWWIEVEVSYDVVFFDRVTSTDSFLTHQLTAVKAASQASPVSIGLSESKEEYVTVSLPLSSLSGKR